MKQTVRLATDRSLHPLKAQSVRQAITPHRLQKVESDPSSEEIRTLMGQGQGQRCLILGTAPSLRNMDLRNLNVDYTFLLNRSYLYTRRPTRATESAVVANPYAFNEYGREIVSLPHQKLFLSSAIPLNHRELTHIDAVFFQQWEWPRIYEGFFQTDLTQPLYHGTSVAFTAIQFAYWMGFSEIILAGIEFDFAAAEPHAYTSSKAEVERARRTSIKNTKRMISSLKYCVQFLEATGGPRIRSVSPNPTLDFIEYCNVEDLSER